MTDKTTLSGTGLDAFEQVLERFGSDRTRWPAPVRRTFTGLLAENPEAQRRLREAEALDRLLDAMPATAVDTAALASRIVSAAMQETRRASPAKARSTWQSAFERPRFGDGRTYWPAAAVLAASLVIGAFSGLSGAFDSAVGPQVAATTYDDADAGQIALDSEEDFL